MSSFTGEFRVAVIGLGKIGLPLALSLALNGCTVKGVDSSKTHVEDLNNGTSRVSEPELEDKLRSALDKKTFIASTDFEEPISSSDYVIVAVPLIANSDGKIDYSIIDSVTKQIGNYARPGITVIYETTLPIGVTRNRLANSIAFTSGLRFDEDLFVAYSPERISSGSAFRDLARYPKLVGGISPASAASACRLYEFGLTFNNALIDSPRGPVWNLGSAESAEFAKLAETTFRDVNIALANTFANHASDLGLSFSAIREACNSQPYSMIHEPGVSVGGHCIPVYPLLYMNSDKGAVLVETAREVNKATPYKCVETLLTNVASPKPNILVAGLSYRTGVKEAAFSGALDLVDAILSQGGVAQVTDELFSDDEIESFGLEPASMQDSFDGLIINSGTREYNLSLIRALKVGAPVFDGRGLLRSSDYPNLITIGESA